MTQIVYDGKALYADRKVYAGGMFSGECKKLKTKVIDGKKYHYAFAGGLADCTLAEKIVESGFDPELQKQAIERIGHERLNDEFMGIVVEMVNPATTMMPNHRVYLANYAGELCEMTPYTFLVIGALEQTIRDFKRGVDFARAKIWQQERVDKNLGNMEVIIRNALAGTSQTQESFIIDKIIL